MDLFPSFIRFIKQENLFGLKDHLLLAVSGGVDSVVLCELCKQASFSFTIAHCNFRLRGDESDRDERFVLELGKKYDVPVMVKRFETKVFAEEEKLSIQVAARQLRYGWFKSIINDHASPGVPPFDRNITLPPPLHAVSSVSGSHIGITPALIVTAHHADDNIETMLMNFFKGTGIAGMGGISPRQGQTVRPLLFARKRALLDFAAQRHLQYAEDSSNASSHYTRNYFRNEVIPAIQKVFPEVEENLLKNIKRFRESGLLYQQAIDQHKRKLLEIKGNEIHIPALKLKKIVPLESIVYEIFKDYAFTGHQAKKIIDLIDGPSGKFVLSKEYRVLKHRKWLILSPVKSDEPQIVLITAADQEVAFPGGILACKHLPAEACQLSAAADTAQLDATHITFPLVLRKRKPGDYFYPLGMTKKKKISRFLTDLRLPLTEKENVWVLEMSNKIIWVIGRRIDNRFRLTDKTLKVLQITVVSGDGKTHQKEPA